MSKVYQYEQQITARVASILASIKAGNMTVTDLTDDQVLTLIREDAIDSPVFAAFLSDPIQKARLESLYDRYARELKGH